MNKFYIIPNNKDVNNINEELILPLDGFSIGFDVYFNIEEINELSLKYNVYVMMNKFLHKKIEEFRKIYNKFNSNIKFIFNKFKFL